ncbi:MAG: dephospho-CoA kinase [Flavobacteriales bacterium]|nr:dephospho-CoA kinase [Flavobacteriales bacterium]
MVQIAVTGNIGCGKTTICQMMENEGVPVYYSDVHAKQLMNQNESLIDSIKERFGKESYYDGMLNRKWIASIVFDDATALNDLNNLVHPVVQKDYLNWLSQQTKDIVAYESAILIEHGNQGNFDFVILVQCPEKIRSVRIQKRDGLTLDEVQARTRFQLQEEEKINYADYLIENTSLEEAKQQLNSVISSIRKQLQKD